MLAYASWHIIKPTFASLLDTGATPKQREEIAKTIRSFTDVIDLHKLRTRHIGSNTLAIDVHIQVKPTMTVTEAHDLSHEIQNRMKNDSRNIIDVFVHVEPYYGR
jgi:cation diffusion facilitator family transporter